MKNYIITSNEYDIATKRLITLENRREKLKTTITNCTSKIKEVVTSGGYQDDKMSNYVAELEEVENEIKEVAEEIKILKDDLDYMNNRISNIKEIKEQVFVYYFIKGMKPLQIAPKIPCSKSSVYRYIDEINRERANWEKIRKI